MITTGGQLSYWMRKKSDFKGIYSRHQRRIPLQGSFIINTDSANLPGKHWIAVKRTPRATYIFDAASWIPNRSICRQLFGGDIYYNSTHTQNLSDTNCGQHCVFWLYNDYPASSDEQACTYINKHCK